MKIEFLESKEFRDKFTSHSFYNIYDELIESEFNSFKDYLQTEIEKLIKEREREAYHAGAQIAMEYGMHQYYEPGIQTFFEVWKDKQR